SSAARPSLLTSHLRPGCADRSGRGGGRRLAQAAARIVALAERDHRLLERIDDRLPAPGAVHHPPLAPTGDEAHLAQPRPRPPAAPANAASSPRRGFGGRRACSAARPGATPPAWWGGWAEIRPRGGARNGPDGPPFFGPPPPANALSPRGAPPAAPESLASS